MPDPAAVMYLFDEFCLDVRGGELARGDERVPLSPKVFQLLVYLVENHSRLLTKEDLLNAVWPDTHVSEGSLNRAVATLRAALADDAENPRFIETIPWRGYKFIGRVEERRDQPAERLQESGSAGLIVYLNREYPLKLGENFIGRESACTVPIVSPSVSRRHARIDVSAAGAFIEDLGSKNGTFLHGRAVEESTKLEDGDEIRFGLERVRYLVRRDAATLSDLRSGAVGAGETGSRRN